MCALVSDFSTGESFGTIQCSQCMTSQVLILVFCCLVDLIMKVDI